MFSGLSSNTDITSVIQSQLGWPLWLITSVLIVVSIWSIIWKGIALWKSSKKDHKIWFIVLLIVNTIGILEILYIYVFSKMMDGKKPQVQKAEIKSKKKRR